MQVYYLKFFIYEQVAFLLLIITLKLTHAGQTTRWDVLLWNKYQSDKFSTKPIACKFVISEKNDHNWAMSFIINASISSTITWRMRIFLS